MLKINDIRISKDFKLYEFQSPDTCQVLLDPELVMRLQALRDLLGYPVKINSGYRTIEHNKAINGKEFSLHLQGKAADIVAEMTPLDHLFHACVWTGFRGIIVYEDKEFIHVDVRAGSFVQAPAFWRTAAVSKNIFKLMNSKSRQIKIELEKRLQA